MKHYMRILSCNAENAADNLPPLDFTEANDLVKTALARRGLSDALPTDAAVFFGDGHGGRGGGRGGNRGGDRGGDRGSHRGGRGGGLSSQRKELKLDGKSVCHAWNNLKPCNGTPTSDGCKAQTGEERLHRCSWVDNNKFCGKDHKKREHKP